MTSAVVGPVLAPRWLRRAPRARLGTRIVGLARTIAVVRPTLRRHRRLGLRLLVPEHGVEQVLVQPRSVERVAPPPVRQREQRGLTDVGPGDAGPALPGGVRHGRTRGDDVGAHPVDLEGGADLGDLGEHRVGELDLGQQLAGGGDPVGQRALGVGVRLDERLRVGVEGESAAYDLGAQARVARGGDLDGEAEAVEELGAELALLGVHGADEHEAGGVDDRDAVALDGGAAHRGGVEEQVDEVVVEEVDLVDVEDAAVRAGQQAGLVLGDAVGEHLGQVQRAEHAVLGGADGELDEAYGPGLGLGVEPPGVVGRGAVGGGVAGGAGEPVAGDHLDRRQHRGEGADGRGLGRALLAAHEDAADLGGDRGEDQGEGHVVAGVLGGDDGGQGVLQWHGGSRSRCQLNVCGGRPVFGLPGSPLSTSRVTAAGPVPDSHRLPRFSPDFGAPLALCASR